MSESAEPVVIKAFAVVEAILEAGRPLSLPELAETLERPKQTVHRTARQLEQNGFLYREPNRDRYAIGPKLFAVSRDVMGWCMRYAPRHATLRRLVEEVGETCNVGILDGDEVFYLDRVESNFPLRAELQPGSRVPVHCTGLGKLLLAYMAPRTRKRMLNRLSFTRYTAQTITDTETLDRACTEVRERGYSVNNQEYHDGIISLAVPLMGGNDRVISGLAVHAPAVRLTVDEAVKLVPTLQQFATELAGDGEYEV